MSAAIVIDGDQAMFLPAFGVAVVVVQPGRISGSGPATIAGRKACVDGDETSVSVPGCMYVAPPYVIPGTGTITIDRLGGDQIAGSVEAGGAKLILRGSQFTAKFSVSSPAQQPQASGPIPDASPSYMGNGMFAPSNMTVKAR